MDGLKEEVFRKKNLQASVRAKQKYAEHLGLEAKRIINEAGEISYYIDGNAVKVR
jgi:hypothetical protein